MTHATRQPAAPPQQHAVQACPSSTTMAGSGVAAAAAADAPHARLDLAVWVGLLGQQGREQQGRIMCLHVHGRAPHKHQVGAQFSRAGDSQPQRSPPQPLACAHSPTRTCALREEMRAMNSRADLALPV